MSDSSEKHFILSGWFVLSSFSVLFAVIVFLTGCGNQTSKESQSVKPLTIKDSILLLYNYKLNNSGYKITFLEFGSVGCRECKKMETVMEEIKKMFGEEVNVVFYDVRLKNNKAICDHFNIKMIPVQILLDNEGVETFRHVGFFPADSLSLQIEKMNASY